jgi:hypothetical protein
MKMYKRQKVATGKRKRSGMMSCVWCANLAEAVAEKQLRKREARTLLWKGKVVTTIAKYQDKDGL